MSYDLLDQVQPPKKRYFLLRIVAVTRILLILYAIIIVIADIAFFAYNSDLLGLEQLLVSLGQVVVCIPFLIFNYIRIKSEIRGLSDHPKIWSTFVVLFLCVLFIILYRLIRNHLESYVQVMPSAVFYLFCSVIVVIVITELTYLYLQYKSNRL